MKEYEVTFEVDFTVTIEAESLEEAERLAEDDDWRDEVLDDRSMWDEEFTSTSVEEVEEF